MEILFQSSYKKDGVAVFRVLGNILFDFEEDYLLLANDQKTLEDNREWAEQYAKENKALLGYFVFHDDAVIVS